MQPVFDDKTLSVRPRRPPDAQEMPRSDRTEKDSTTSIHAPGQNGSEGTCVDRFPPSAHPEVLEMELPSPDRWGPDFFAAVEDILSCVYF